MKPEQINEIRGRRQRLTAGAWTSVIWREPKGQVIVSYPLDPTKEAGPDDLMFFRSISNDLFLLMDEVDRLRSVLRRIAEYGDPPDAVLLAQLALEGKE